MSEYFLHPGYICTADDGKVIKTVLGSCVAVCLWDRVKKTGGMNHYVYPRSSKSERTAKYGDLSLPYMLKMILRAGSKKEDLIAHIIGGADNLSLSTKIGEQNYKLARKFLEKHKIHVASEDVGGSIGKKVVFDTSTGEVLIHKCMKIRESDWYE